MKGNRAFHKCMALLLAVCLLLCGCGGVADPAVTETGETSLETTEAQDIPVVAAETQDASVAESGAEVIFIPIFRIRICSRTF